MKILITGHRGFVGRHYVKHLSQNPENEIIGVDLKEQQDCRSFFTRDARVFDLVIHLAAIVGGRETIENDPIAVASDLSIDSEMFNWAVRTKQKRIIYFSSSAAYPISLQKKELQHKLIEEDIDLKDIRTPDYSYGWSKLSGEMLANYASNYGIKVHTFRPFSGYGFDQDLHYPFPSFIKRITDKVECFEIWGDGTQVRDFVHIDDIIEASLKAVELDITEPINLGSGIPISFNELAQLCFKYSGYTPPKGIQHRIDKPTGVEYRCSNNKKLLNFYNLKYNLEEVLENYYSKNR